MFNEPLRDGKVQVAGVIVLLVISTCLLVIVGQRTSMRRLEVCLQGRRATRDSLDAANSIARIDLVRLARADRVFRALSDSGFVTPAGGRTRFLLYPGEVSGGDGLLTRHLAAQLTEERPVVRGNEAWLWGWVRRLPTLRDFEGRDHG
ncbi:MAG: hypothetical protein MUE60_16140 [Candidatus Eisenbacteria bacterium]|jgi:hypothetical protein|nr:hypothetical protein [Candidatus Eisenbacteria bacterium]